MAVPVLWLRGPSGVGKTTAGWMLYSGLVESGVQAGFVDIDQLGICYPAPVVDPGRYLMQARNLGAVVANFHAAGARCVVVSGVADPTHGVHEDLVSAALTVCRLRADEGELVSRLARRGWSAKLIEDVRREARILDASAGLCVDTTGLSVAEVVWDVLERTGWPVLADQGRSPAELEPLDGEVLWLCGATGVGKSAVGFAVYQRILRSGLMAAYVDVDQLGFCPRADQGVRARNVAALWRTYQAAGAQRLVVVGSATDIGAKITLLRLHAGPDQLTERILRRGRGEGWAQPGDPLIGRPMSCLRRVADRSAAEAEALERAGVGRRVDTDGLAVEQVADVITEVLAAHGRW